MENLKGTPGTKFGFLLRVGQCLCAAFSVSHMVTTPDFFTVSAFCFLVASMSLQTAWSFGLAFLDAYSLATKEPLQGPQLVTFFMIGDLATAVLSLAGASSAMGIVMWLYHDSDNCESLGDICRIYVVSVFLAFLSWLMVAFTSLIMVWILAAE